MSKSTSPWVYIGCGCAFLATLALVAVATLGFKAWRDLEAFGETMGDPVARDARVREMFGAEALPGGLRGQFYVRIPFVLALAVATDAEAGPLDDESEGRGHNQRLDVDRHLLSLVDIRNFGESRQSFRAALEAGEDPFATLDSSDIDISVEIDEITGGDRLTVDDTEYVYQTVRGHLSDVRPRRTGVAALLDVRCADDDGRLRILTWFRADDELAADGEATADGTAAQGTAADGTAAQGAMAEAPASPDDGVGRPDDAGDLQRLLGAIDPCRGTSG